MSGLLVRLYTEIPWGRGGGGGGGEEGNDIVLMCRSIGWGDILMCRSLG